MIDLRRLAALLLCLGISQGLAAQCQTLPGQEPSARQEALAWACLDERLPALIDPRLILDTLDDIETLYAEEGAEALWYYRARLEQGNVYEVVATMRLFEEERLFPLLGDVIDLGGRFDAPSEREIGDWLERLRRRALISTAQYFGLWDPRFAASYPDHDIDSWRALFYDTMQTDPGLFSD